MPGRVHVDEERGDRFVVRGSRRAGAGEQHAPRRVLREAGPHLLAVDDPLVAALLGARGQGRQVAAGAGFGEALAPGLTARQQPRHHLRGEFGSRVVDHRRRQHLEHRVRPGLVEPAADDLLADDGPQDRGPAQPARRFRPPVAHPARVVQRAQHAQSAAPGGRPASGRRAAASGRSRRARLRDPDRNSAVLGMSAAAVIRLRACRSRAAGRSRGRRCAG